MTKNKQNMKEGLIDISMVSNPVVDVLKPLSIVKYMK